MLGPLTLAGGEAQAANYPPKPPYGRTKYGFCVWRHPGENYATALARQTAALGQPEVLRYFYGPNPLVWPAEGGATGNISLIVSFKRRPIDVLNGIHDAEISAWLAKLPTTRRTWIAYEHEMDVKVQRHEYELEDVRNRSSALPSSSAPPRTRGCAPR